MSATLAPAASAIPLDPHPRAARVLARCRDVAACTDVPGAITRTFLSPATHRAHALIAGWMQAAAMAVRTDAAGNLRGLWGNPAAPRLLLGSHLDTIPNAGPFDGILGVLLGIALVEEINTLNLALPFAIEVIGFSEEEGVRFARPFLGSLALIGQLTPADLARPDASNITIAQAIRDFGLDPTTLPDAVLHPATFAYLEFHIEQGPVLESEARSLGVVEAIAGQTRMHVTFTGQANHAGTTPMGALRHDALAAAAHWIVEAERYATAHPGLVATVGKVEVPGAASNVVPGAALATLDVRHADDAVRRAAILHLLRSAETAASARGVAVTSTTQLDQAAVPMHPALTSLLARAAAEPRTPARILTCGAGHDAMIVARRLPTAILFLRSPGGLSHHPNEAVLPQDVEAALTTGLKLLNLLATEEAATLRRPSHA